MAECKKKVGQGVIQYPCVILVPDGRAEHEGPCKAVEDQASVARRERWERGGEARATLAMTQSRPLSFAEANPAHAPTPVPGSRLQPAQHREAHRPRVGEFGEEPTPGGDCTHPFNVTIEDANTGEIWCRECGTLLRPGLSKQPAESTLATFVAENSQPTFTPPAELPPVEVGAFVLYQPNLDEPNMAVLARVDALLDSPPGAFQVSSLHDGSKWSLPGKESVLQVYPADADPDAIIASLGWPPRQRPDLGPGTVTETGIVADPPPVTLSAPEPTKQREGDQQLPAQNNPRMAVQDIIIEAMHESKRVGTERYGQPLKPMNGRDTLLDAHEEARDLYVYLTAEREERKEMSALMEEAWTSIIDHFGIESPEGQAMRKVCLWLRGTPQT